MSGLVNGKTMFASSSAMERGNDQRLLDEDTFRRVLSRERKRAERSGESILLLMLDLTPVPDGDRDHAAALVSEPIAGVLRQTDAYGWLETSALLGIVFTDIARTAVGQAMQTVELKVRGCIKARLLPSVYQKIRLSILVFPGEHDEKEQGEWFNPVFYPEIDQRELPARTAGTFKRLMDLAGSIAALALFAPFFMVIPLLVKLTSPGPVFFRQVRLGQYGKPFTFLKFRTMHVNNDDTIHRDYVKNLITNKVKAEMTTGSSEVVFKIRNDPRITSIGNFLRKTSIDELPQFINVLKGEMSLVGPRPPIPYEVSNYDAWHLYRILAGKPGITGLWQVKGRSLTTFDGMVRLDLQYIRTWSLWLDIKLLLATPLAVIRGKGAY
jgi:lipopolysaccharide/colanic/teichoic acid biosynthesis glycosyltransferase